jgi:hypothetical protein
MEPESEFLDLKSISFDEFVSLIFERDVSAEHAKFDPPFCNVEPEIDAQKMCSYYVQLFQKPEFLLSRFTKQELEEGFWEIMGYTHDWSLGNLIDYSDAPLSIRKKCIESMAVLFERFFANESLDTSVHMWWDSRCYSWHCGNRKRERGGEDLELQDIYFQTLGKVLAIDSWICQGAALHGLGHLHHPDTADLISRYIDAHPSLTEEQIAYAKAAAKFEVL